MIEQMTAQGSMLVCDGGHVRPRVPTGGCWEDSILDPQAHTGDGAYPWAL